jgi:hypothetical protein
MIRLSVFVSEQVPGGEPRTNHPIIRPTSFSEPIDDLASPLQIVRDCACISRGWRTPDCWIILYILTPVSKFCNSFKCTATTQASVWNSIVSPCLKVTANTEILFWLHLLTPAICWSEVELLADSDGSSSSRHHPMCMLWRQCCNSFEPARER